MAASGSSREPRVKFRRSQARRRAHIWASAGVCVIAGVLVCIKHTLPWLSRASSSDASFLEHRPSGRDVEASVESDAADQRRLDMYPDDGILTKPYAESDNQWVIILHVIGIAYMFLGLNTVCDIYFTGALECMVEKWEIKPDVAGATFMAAGGSAPELFTSLVGTTIAINDVGFGTIVGSAVFNVLFVIGLCGYVAKTPIDLTWWPLFRDCSFYICSLTLLAVFASDAEIAIYEAFLLFCAYLLYCTIMYFNPVLERLVDFEYLKAKKEAEAEAMQRQESPDRQPSPEERSAEGDDVHLTEKKKLDCTVKVHHAKARLSVNLSAAANERHNQRMASVSSCQVGFDAPPANFSPKPSPGLSPSVSDENLGSKQEEGGEKEGKEEEEEEEEELGLLEMPEGLKDRIVWAVSLPVYYPLYYGIPEADETWFIWTFIVSLIWIAGFSFLLVWWAEIVGQVIGIPTIIMGLTVLAAGTSIPDAASSMAVARIGEGDMAVSSSVGSNIFDILVGLPVPWMIKIGLIQRDTSFTIVITSPFLTFYVLLLLFMVVAVVLSIHLMNWKLNKALGMCMAALYAVFLAVALTVEIGQPTALMF